MFSDHPPAKTAADSKNSAPTDEKKEPYKACFIRALQLLQYCKTILRPRKIVIKEVHITQLIAKKGQADLIHLSFKVSNADGTREVSPDLVDAGIGLSTKKPDRFEQPICPYLASTEEQNTNFWIVEPDIFDKKLACFAAQARECYEKELVNAFSEAATIIATINKAKGDRSKEVETQIGTLMQKFITMGFSMNFNDNTSLRCGNFQIDTKNHEQFIIRSSVPTLAENSVDTTTRRKSLTGSSC